MATKDIEGALRCLVMDATADRCGALADALGVGHACGVSDDVCYGCASRIAKAAAARMMPEGVEWPRFEPEDTQELIDADSWKHPCDYFGRAYGDCHADGGCPALRDKGGCSTAMTRDLLRRQLELCRRKEGGTR